MGGLPNRSHTRKRARENAVVKSDCQSCLRVTNHEVLREHVDKRYLPDWDGTEWDRFQIIKCSGCDRTSFRRAKSADHDLDPGTGGPREVVTVYPPRLSGRKLMDGTVHVPEGVRRIYVETHSALAAGNPILGTIGIRGVVEAVCNDKKAKGSKLEEKIEDLPKQGWLSQKEAEFLHKSRVLGNVAAHELRPPEPRLLQTSLDIVETLLKTVYVLPGTLKG